MGNICNNLCNDEKEGQPKAAREIFQSSGPNVMGNNRQALGSDQEYGDQEYDSADLSGQERSPNKQKSKQEAKDDMPLMRTGTMTKIKSEHDKA